MLKHEKNEESRENHQIPYDYTVEVTKRLKGLDLRDSALHKIVGFSELK